ncbi:MAG: hypothetical protein KBB39_09820 [Phycicoccus sp.]|nr:hypothetical protein [Phycicoccus sp.]
MQPDEARDFGQVAGSTLRSLTTMVRGAHFATSDAVHGLIGQAVGPAAAPVKVISDGVTAGVYAATALGVDLVARAAGQIAAHRLGEGAGDRPSVHDGPAAHSALAIGLGLRGDTIAREARSIAADLHVRGAGRRVPLSRESVAAAFPEATSDIVVFLHGLFETEAHWGLAGEERTLYPDRLHTDLGLTPVLIRFNTGLRISDNGAVLDQLLSELVAAWPVPVRRIVLIGHSMGGLVLHSALAIAGAAAESRPASEDAEWLPLVSDTVTLGTPHDGSPIARGVAAAANALDRSESSRWATDLLRLRSGGIRDLEHGNVVAQDWACHPDDSGDRRTHPMPADDISHYAVVAVTTDGVLPAHLSDLVGDFVVPAASARHSGSALHVRRFRDDQVAVVPRVGHLGLLNSEAAYEQMRTWLSGS